MTDGKQQKSLTYRDAGVDVAAGDAFARWIGKRARDTHGPGVVGGIGGFAGMFAVPAGLEDPLLVSGTDGVGTKLKVAFAADRHDTVGIDLVAMCVNDIVTVGAKPLFFLDYLATAALNPQTLQTTVEGIVQGCEQAGCALIGGETAEMPGMYAGGEYDLAGFAVGVVERARVIDGQRARAGDAVIGLPSSGLHSNGFSLARRVLIEEGTDLNAVVPELSRSLADELLTPTRIYARAVAALLEGGVDVRALSHITGGGLIDNPPRATPDDLAWRLDPSTWSVPAVMSLIAERGNVALNEMRRTFNMGLGLLAVVPTNDAERAVDLLVDEDARVVGALIPRTGDAVEFAP